MTTDTLHFPDLVIPLSKKERLTRRLVNAGLILAGVAALSAGVFLGAYAAEEERKEAARREHVALCATLPDEELRDAGCSFELYLVERKQQEKEAAKRAAEWAAYTPEQQARYARLAAATKLDPLGVIN